MTNPAFPSWTIALVIILIAVSASTTAYFVFRKRVGKKRGAVGAQQDEFSLEKNTSTHSPSSSAYPAIKPLMPYNYADKNEVNCTLKGSQTSSNHESNSCSSSTIPSTLPASPYTYKSNRSVDGKKPASQQLQPQEKESASPNTTVIQLSDLVKEDNASSVWTDGAPCYPKEQDSFKINLPLTPPRTSFFSDKMELDSIEANDLYQSYINVSQQQQDYVSIELDDKPFLSSAAANIQQKAATLRSTLRQSLRRKSTTNKSSGAPLSQFFDNMSHNTSNSSIRSPAKSSSEYGARMSRQSSSTSSRFPRSSLQTTATPSLPTNLLPLPPKIDSPMEYFANNACEKSNNSSKKSLTRHEVEDQKGEESNSNKIMIDTIPPESYFSLPMSPATPSPYGAVKPLSTPLMPSSEVIVPDYASVVDEINQYSNSESSINDTDTEISKEVQDTTLDECNNKQTTPQEAASAARKIIRSASRKSRTRSMTVTEEANQAMFTSLNNGDNVPSTPAAAATAKYATVRGMNTKPQQTDNDTTRPSTLDIKKWSASASNPSSPKSTTPSPNRAIMSSISSGSATVSGRKMQQESSSDNLLASHRNDLKSATLGRKPIRSTQGPKSLSNLFAHPDGPLSEKALVVEQQNDMPSPSARSSLSIITTEQQPTETDATLSSPIAVVESSSPYSSKNNTLSNKMGSNVDNIRRMLQSSWSGNNLKESGSNHSLASSSGGDTMTGSVGSSYRPVASPLGSVNPRLQNQHLVSLSLKAQQHQQARSRPSMPIGFMDEGGPAPTASFSSSTVRTMIPAEEDEQAHQKKPSQEQQSRLRMQEKKSSLMGGLLGSRQNNNNRIQQPSKLSQGGTLSKKQSLGKTPAQKEQEKYLKSLEKRHK